MTWWRRILRVMGLKQATGRKPRVDTTRDLRRAVARDYDEIRRRQEALRIRAQVRSRGHQERGWTTG